ncbi:hypothetical protein HO173_010046 [Letharia columbiana]|uniref:Uncharacterized protein n=1 Tax=Letharia columbiana TaxID=112416 RepID=A0A8H6FNF1_9LECA|nr:uncharacterized protein HO173_010046 [Letharia columbiana]KAF6231744.1 hypothetical protein HO173_010046 [Letharia columbiana]
MDRHSKQRPLNYLRAPQSFQRPSDAANEPTTPIAQDLSRQSTIHISPDTGPLHHRPPSTVPPHLHLPELQIPTQARKRVLATLPTLVSAIVQRRRRRVVPGVEPSEDLNCAGFANSPDPEPPVDEDDAFD